MNLASRGGRGRGGGGNKGGTGRGGGAPWQGKLIVFGLNQFILF